MNRPILVVLYVYVRRYLLELLRAEVSATVKAELESDLRMLEEVKAFVNE